MLRILRYPSTELALPALPKNTNAAALTPVELQWDTRMRRSWGLRGIARGVRQLKSIVSGSRFVVDVSKQVHRDAEPQSATTWMQHR